MIARQIVSILLFHEVDVSDFAGPFEVLSIAENDTNNEHFRVITIAEHQAPISARNRLAVIPDYIFKNHPNVNIFIIPGGYGTERVEINNTAVINWITQSHSNYRYYLLPF